MYLIPDPTVPKMLDEEDIIHVFPVHRTYDDKRDILRNGTMVNSTYSKKAVNENEGKGRSIKKNLGKKLD